MSNSIDSEQNQFEETKSSNSFLPKPIYVEQTNNSLLRAMLTLFFYGLLFYFMFDNNLVYMAAVLIVIIIHEMGHFFSMKLFNYSNIKIFILPILGLFNNEKKQHASQKKLALIILAGPLPGILIGVILIFINKEFNNSTLKILSNSFLFINLLTCLPFYPLDGGRLIEILFFKESYIIRLAFGVISIISFLVLSVIILNPLLFFISLWIGFELYNENKNQKIRDYLKQEKINYYTNYNDLKDQDYWLIRDCLLFSFPKKYKDAEPGKYEYSFFETLIVKHINSILKVNLKFDLSFFSRIVILVFYFFIVLAPLALIVLNN